MVLPWTSHIFLWRIKWITYFWASVWRNVIHWDHFKDSDVYSGKENRRSGWFLLYYVYMCTFTSIHKQTLFGQTPQWGPLDAKTYVFVATEHSEEEKPWESFEVWEGLYMVAWDIGSPEGYEWFIGWLFLLLFCVGVFFFWWEEANSIAVVLSMAKQLILALLITGNPISARRNQYSVC